MPTQWKLNCRGGPLETAQSFLSGLWQQARLEGMLAPLRLPDAYALQPMFIGDPNQLAQVDPFAPLMTVNAATLVVQLLRDHPGLRFGAVLRPCELRALAALARREALRLNDVLTIGVDCLGTFPAEDYRWRAESRGPEALTREALQFAHSGGIAPYRYRFACQICSSPMPETADISLGALGCHLHEAMLVAARDEHTAQRLQLATLTDGAAPPAMIAQHEQMRTALLERHQSRRERLEQSISARLPREVETFIQHLSSCAPCQACLRACPLYASEIDRLGGSSRAAVSRWLADCAQCGMCEAACPQHLPLTTVIGRIRTGLLDEWIAA